jgi:hypothetical protein
MVDISKYAFPEENDEPEKDTDLDSWNSGDNKPDAFDDAEYDAEISDEAAEGKLMPDEGDEKDLGISEDTADDLVNLGEDLHALDDSKWRDDSFDCD